MSKLLAALGLSTALAGAASLPLATAADAAMTYGAQGAAGLENALTPVEKAQFFFGGNNYCWYPVGWHGPGWYWCGYAWNNGYGWGGGYGWHGWGGGPGWRNGWHPHPGPGQWHPHPLMGHPMMGHPMMGGHPWKKP
jgi:hypothetical protein